MSKWAKRRHCAIHEKFVQVQISYIDIARTAHCYKLAAGAGSEFLPKSRDMELEHTLLGLSLGGLMRPGYDTSTYMNLAKDAFLTYAFILLQLLQIISTFNVEQTSLLNTLLCISQISLTIQIINLRTFFTNHKGEIKHLIDKFDGK
jgi:hypothetical protein